jgi:phosphoribosyl-dephospho-CoA transferase
MKRLRLKHSSTPARIYGLEDYSEFGYHGMIKINIVFKGKNESFITGYTKPYNNKIEGVFANLVNINQYGDKNLKKIFNEWQDKITINGTLEIDIFDFEFQIISRKN